MDCKGDLLVLIILFQTVICRSTAIMEKTVVGIIGAENYTYYSLSQPGFILVVLHSFQGDADLYISAGNGMPTYDVENHDLQSTTCGLDFLTVPSHFKRPITIGVYGHVSHFSSMYQMDIYIDESPDYDEIQSNGYEGDPYEDKYEKKPSSPPPLVEPPIKDSESFLWTIIFGILKVLFDILVD